MWVGTQVILPDIPQANHPQSQTHAQQHPPKTNYELKNGDVGQRPNDSTVLKVHFLCFLCAFRFKKKFLSGHPFCT